MGVRSCGEEESRALGRCYPQKSRVNSSRHKAGGMQVSTLPALFQCHGPDQQELQR